MYACLTYDVGTLCNQDIICAGHPGLKFSKFAAKVPTINLEVPTTAVGHRLPCILHTTLPYSSRRKGFAKDPQIK